MIKKEDFKWDRAHEWSVNYKGNRVTYKQHPRMSPMLLINGHKRYVDGLTDAIARANGYLKELKIDEKETVNRIKSHYSKGAV